MKHRYLKTKRYLNHTPICIYLDFLTCLHEEVIKLLYNCNLDQENNRATIITVGALIMRRSKIIIFTG